MVGQPEMEPPPSGSLEGVTLSSTPPKAFGPERGRVAGVVAVGLAFMLRVAP